MSSIDMIQEILPKDNHIQYVSISAAKDEPVIHLFGVLTYRLTSCSYCETYDYIVKNGH